MAKSNNAAFITGLKAVAADLEARITTATSELSKAGKEGDTDALRSLPKLLTSLEGDQKNVARVLARYSPNSAGDTLYS